MNESLYLPAISALLAHTRELQERNSDGCVDRLEGHVSFNRYPSLLRYPLPLADKYSLERIAPMALDLIDCRGDQDNRRLTTKNGWADGLLASVGGGVRQVNASAKSEIP
jgi:hypothetical protein